MDSDTMMVLILFGAAAILILIVIMGSLHHVKKAKFKPRFVTLSDGSVQMEFDGFGGLQSTRTERFLEEYRKGQTVTYSGRTYYIEEIKEVANPTTLRNDLKMVCYLKERI